MAQFMLPIGGLSDAELIQRANLKPKAIMSKIEAISSELSRGLATFANPVRNRADCPRRPQLAPDSFLRGTPTESRVSEYRHAPFPRSPEIASLARARVRRDISLKDPL